MDVLNVEQAGTGGQPRGLRVQWQILGDTPRPGLCQREPAQAVVVEFIGDV